MTPPVLRGPVVRARIARASVPAPAGLTRRSPVDTLLLALREMLPQSVGRVGAIDRGTVNTRPVATWRRDFAANDLAITTTVGWTGTARTSPASAKSQPGGHGPLVTVMTPVIEGISAW